MARGRKPDANAVRRKKDRAEIVPQLVEGTLGAVGVEKPPSVLAVPAMSALWDSYVGTGIAYKPEDAPLIEQMVYYLETARQCRERCMDGNGNIMPVIGRGEPDEATGEYLDYGKNPWFEAMGTAMDRALKLADQLGCTPLARARLGLTQAAGAAVAVSIADQVDAAMRRARK